jgi:hypothetical protein
VTCRDVFRPDTVGFCFLLRCDACLFRFGCDACLFRFDACAFSRVALFFGFVGLALFRCFAFGFRVR